MKQKILVVGDLMLNHYIKGDASRLSPEAPVPVVHVQEEFYRLGGAANTAKNINKLGHSCGLVGFIGNDKNGIVLKRLLNDQQIDNHFFVPNDSSITITKTRVMAGHQQIVRVDNEIVLPDTNNFGTDNISQVVNGFDGTFILVSDYGKGVCSESVMQILLSKSGSKKVLIDPKGVNWKKYANAFLVKPNLKELALIANREILNTDEAVAKAGEEVRSKFNFEHLLVTRGAKGMTLISEGAIKHITIDPIHVFDVSGAGDTVIAVLVVMLNEGHDLNNAILVANEAGRLAVSRRYTYAITREELDEIKTKLNLR